MKLWLVRHAAPEVAPGTCYGKTDVPALTEHTLRLAGELASALPARVALQVSPLVRCADAAKALHAVRPDVPPRTDPRLAEMDFGSWEGRPWDAIGREAMDAWMRDFARHAPGGGEPVNAFMQRVAAAYDETVLAARDCAWITHAGVIRAALLLQQGQRTVSRADQWPAAAIGFGQWIVLEIPSPR